MEMQIRLEDLPHFAPLFWQEIKSAKVILFHGNMGAGKTTTIVALCKHIGVEGAVGSPTFSIINEYQFKREGKAAKLYHIDLYRMKDLEEMIQAGVEDCVYSGEICFVEWPEKAPELFDQRAMHVCIEALDEHTRKIKILSDTAFHAHSMAEQS
jgi:tRNA threonylcarbamoyladenosine biosynthesis protein TsaE